MNPKGMDEFLETICEHLENQRVKKVSKSRRASLKQLNKKITNNPHYYVAWDKQCEEWLDKKDISSVLNLSTLKRFRKGLSPFYPLMKDGSSADMDPFCYCKGHQMLFMFFFEAYVAVRFHRENCCQRVCKLVRRSFRLVQRHYQSHPTRRDYVDGVTYLWRWFLLDAQLAQKTFAPGFVQVATMDYDSEQEFQALNKKSKAIVNGFKYALLSTYDYLVRRERSRKARINLMKKIVLLDPKEYFWHYHFQNILRNIRRSYGNNNPEISKQEIRILWETYADCDYEKIDLTSGKESIWRKMAFAGVLQGLAELLRYKMCRNQQLPLKFGELEFISFKETVNYLKTKISGLIWGDCECTYAEYIRYGEIMGNILPNKYRDYKIAEHCYWEAYKKNSSSSKINHKLGNLYILKHHDNDNKEEGIKRGLSYLQEAVKLCPLNFPALGTLLRALLHSPKENQTEITEILEKYKGEQACHSEISQADLKRCEGYFEFMCKSPIRGVVAFVDAYKIHNGVDISELVFVINKYGWSTELISPALVKNELKHFLENCKDKEVQCLAEELIASIPSAVNLTTDNFLQNDYSHEFIEIALNSESYDNLREWLN